MLCGKATVVTKKRSFLEQNANSEEELAIIGFQLVFSRTRSHGLPACLANDQVLITHQTILKL